MHVSWAPAAPGIGDVLWALNIVLHRRPRCHLPLHDVVYRCGRGHNVLSDHHRTRMYTIYSEACRVKLSPSARVLDGAYVIARFLNLDT